MALAPIATAAEQLPGMSPTILTCVIDHEFHVKMTPATPQKLSHNISVAEDINGTAYTIYSRSPPPSQS